MKKKKDISKRKKINQNSKSAQYKEMANVSTPAIPNKKEVSISCFELLNTEFVDQVVRSTKEKVSDLPESALKETIAFKLENLGFIVGEKIAERFFPSFYLLH